MEIRPHPAFARELAEQARDRPADARAVRNALRFLAAEGTGLGFPWTSAVRGEPGMRELRPRRGRCAIRVLYRRHGTGLDLLAIAPDGAGDPRRFGEAVARARARASDLDDRK